MLPPVVGRYFETLHQGHGVAFHFATAVREFCAAEKGTVAVTDRGTEIPADLVVAAIGVEPNAEIAAAAGLGVDRGILVDEFGSTSQSGIFAAGDVARHFNPLMGRHILLESWQNAQNQAIAIARNIATPDHAAPYAEIPWFWSDQYDRNLQMYGIMQDGGDFITRGRMDGRWIVFQLKNGQVIFAAGVNCGRALRPVRKLIQSGIMVSAAALSDPEVSIADLSRAPGARVDSLTRAIA
jgi:NADPH-dependent 2,4-dienoyl-CoA reductase/sulfur reductase-like enzyme